MDSKALAYSYAGHAQGMGKACAVADAPTNAVRLYALVDVPQCSGFAARLKRWPLAGPAFALYQDTFAANAMALSPQLLQLPDAAANINGTVTAIQELSAWCDGAPALSFIGSSRPLDALARHLQDLLLLDTDDQAFLLRLADTHALASAVGVLTPSQRSRFLQGITGWWVVDQRSRLIELHAQDHAVPAEPLPLKFAPAQLDALLQASAVSIVAAQLRNTDPEFAKRRFPEQIDYVACHAERARAVDLDTSEDLHAWCLAALRGGEQFDRHPMVRMALIEARISRDPQRLSQAFAALSDDDWESARRAGTLAEQL